MSVVVTVVPLKPLLAPVIVSGRLCGTDAVQIEGVVEDHRRRLAGELEHAMAPAEDGGWDGVRGKPTIGSASPSSTPPCCATGLVSKVSHRSASFLIPGKVCFSSTVISYRVLVASFLMAPAAVAFDGAFKPLGGVWDVEGGPITYVLDPAGSADIGDDSELDAIRDAFRGWACVPGTSLRFEEGEGPGPRVMSTDDGKNTLMWDESGNDCLMGPGTLGITVGDVGSNPRNAADICFNGRDHTWGVATETDVQSIALHEIGHFIGLDHPCDNDQDSASCIPSTRALMFPSWSGVPEREPLESDIAGVLDLYPAGADDPSGCQGPFRAGERCACNDECVEGLVCAPDGTGELRCGRTCGVRDRDCGSGSTCVLDVPQDGQDAVGLCIRAERNAKPPGSICATGTECDSGTCGALISLGTSICQARCTGDDDCAGGSCFEGFCLGGFESEACPVLEPDCGCTTTTTTTTTTTPALGVGLAVGMLGVMLRRRRRS
jgi:hypothetical protein